MYNTNSKIISQTNLADFVSKGCTITQCPPYNEHEFSSILMTTTLRNVN
jgi:hypothetical protein